MKNKEQNYLDLLKKGEYRGKILITSDIHKDISQLEKISKNASKNGANIAIDLGDLDILPDDDNAKLEDYQNSYDSIVKKNGLNAGLTLIEIAGLKNDKIRDELKDMNIDSYLNDDKILASHFINYDSNLGERFALNFGSPDSINYYKYDKEKFEKFLDERKNMPILILKGHDHRSFITEKIDGNYKLKSISSNVNNPLAELSPYEKYDGEHNINFIEKNEKATIKITEPGLYIINPGNARCTLLDIQDKKYTLEFK